jgi:hypothetical protein
LTRARRTVPVVLPAFVVAKVLTLATMLVSISRGDSAVSWSRLHDAFLHWDALSYVDIAAHGYPAHLDYHDAFLPGYPLLIRAASVVTRDLVTGGVLVSGLAELVALVAVLVLVRRERDEATARFAVWAVALLPLGFFFSGVYTESPFIAGVALSLLLARAGRFRTAAVAAAFATAMRVTGIVLLPVLIFEVFRQRRVRSDGMWVTVVALPLVLYGAYMQVHTGDALALVHAESLPSFGEALAWPWDGLRLTWVTAATSSDPTNQAIFIREIAAGLVGGAVVAAGWQDSIFPRSFALYGTLVWLLGVSLSFWRSVPRYDLALFPAVIVVADATRRAQRIRPVILAASGAVLVWGAWVFAEGGWIG